MNKNEMNIDEEIENDTSSNDELENRINKLYGISSTDNNATITYDPVQLQLIRKKLFILLMIIILFGILFVFVVLNPFKSNRKVLTSDNSQVDNNDQNNDLETEEKEIPIGDIDLSNETVLKLNRLVAFSLADFYSVDLFPIYQKNLTTSEQIPNNIKMYIIKKAETFYDLLNTIGIDKYISTCDSEGLSITNDQMNMLISKVLGPNISLNNGSYYFTYYYDDTIPINLEMIKSDNQYLVRCKDFSTNNNITKYFQQNLERAVKTESGIEIYHRIVFIRQDGVYKDVNFGNLITNNPATQKDEYITKGTLYKYTFAMDEEKDYYLSSIELVKED